ncbi:hypothetical protein N7540_003378 [Penicillium herquei]|nr:hypothetical protein N7540_003378 [Penicillium herquei]
MNLLTFEYVHEKALAAEYLDFTADEREKQETLAQLSIVLHEAQEAGLQDEYSTPFEVNMSSQPSKCFRQYIRRELEILVDSLLQTFPSLLPKVRVQEVIPSQRIRIAVPHSLELDKSQSVSADDLLNVALQLIDKITVAFDKMRVADGKMASQVSFDEATMTLFDREVASLRKWKEDNGPKMKGKPTPQNKAVWEVLNETIFNVTNLLSQHTPATNLSQPLLIFCR